MNNIGRCATALLLLAGGSHTVMACASVPPRPTPTPEQWKAIDCAGCERAGVTIETRRTVDGGGRAGRYLLARVSNHNAHGVVFDLSLTSSRVTSGDPDFLSKGWRVTLARAGETSAAATLAMELADVTAASVSGVERY